MSDENWYDVIIGDCIAGMQTLEAKSVHTCVTSPPYFGLRDYQMDGQIGLEDTPEAYVARLVDVFREVWRVLRDDGTAWLNLGDSYAAARGGTHQPAETPAGGKGGKTQDGSSVNRGRFAGYNPTRNASAIGLKHKDLIGIPWRVAFALQADGWYLRQDIIWHKPNPMPESVRDRCTKAHEYIFLLSKEPKYYFDSEAMKEPGVVPAGTKGAKGSAERAAVAGVNSRPPEYKVYNGMRNRRSVWTVTTKPYAGAHFATFPPDLIEPCVLAGSPAQCCAICGAACVSEMVDSGVENQMFKGAAFPDGKTGARNGDIRTQEGARALKVTGSPMPTCACNGGFMPGVVLDPFGGSGTTAGVALKHGRNAILCELNPDYDTLIDARVDSIRYGKKA